MITKVIQFEPGDKFLTTVLKP